MNWLESLPSFETDLEEGAPGAFVPIGSALSARLSQAAKRRKRIKGRFADEGIKPNLHRPQIARPDPAAPRPGRPGVPTQRAAARAELTAQPGGKGRRYVPDKNGVYRVGRDVSAAADLLSQGKKVELERVSEVSVLLDQLAALVKDAKDKGEKAPDFDLCKITVPGTNLFCAESKGIPRIKMPQLGGVPTPGSKADKLEKNERGEVDLARRFRREMEKVSSVRDATVPASHLKASQIELNGAKVAEMTKALDSGGTLGGDPRIFVSADDYIVDGHHRWAANVGHDLHDGVLGDVSMPVAKVDMGIIELLDAANKFAAAWGIPQAAVGQQLPDAKKK